MLDADADADAEPTVTLVVTRPSMFVRRILLTIALSPDEMSSQSEKR